MKKCGWCGKEYSDIAERCLIDGQPLTGGGPLFAVEAPAEAVTSASASPELSTTATAIPEWHPTDAQIRIFELVLLCAIAFAGSIVYSMQHIPGVNSGSATGGSRSWLYSGVHELSALALLWYILLRRSKSFTDLGFSWVNRDVLHSVLIWVLGSIAFSVVYGLIHAAGFTSTPHSAASARVGRQLFGGGVTPLAIAFQFLNPFFEELIVRAYLMTEVKQLTNSVAKAVMLSTLLQTSYHFYQGAPMAISEGAVFLVSSLYYAKSNRITPVILAHMYMDVLATLSFMLRHS